MLPVHPGEALRLEMDARGLSANSLALALRVPPGRISDILSGKRRVTLGTALRLGRYFETDPELWLNLQSAYDRAMLENELALTPEAQQRFAEALIDPPGLTPPLLRAKEAHARLIEIEPDISD